MARGRMLSRSESDSRAVRAMVDHLQSPWPAVFHPRLIAWLDVNGNVRADRYWLKGNIMRLDREITPENCQEMVLTMVKFELAQLYEVEGEPFLHFPTFEKHQAGLRKDRENPEVPAPEWQTSAVPPEGLRPSRARSQDPVPQNGGPGPDQGGTRAANLAGEEEEEVEEEVEEEGEKGRKNEKPTVRESEAFNRFWARYPRKMGKQRAVKAWNARMGQGEDPEAILQGLERYIRWIDHSGTTQDFIKHPATFLGPDRWWEEDYPLDDERGKGGGKANGKSPPDKPFLAGETIVAPDGREMKIGPEGVT